MFKQKLPQRVVPEDMHECEAINIVCHPHTRLSSSYTISDLDGHVCVNKWSDFMMKQNHLVIGEKVMMLLYVGDHGIYLFVFHIPEEALE